MQYIMTFIWSFVLVTMLNYVVCSVLGAEFDFMTGVILSLVVSVLTLIAVAIIPNGPVAEAKADQH